MITLPKMKLIINSLTASLQQKKNEKHKTVLLRDTCNAKTHSLEDTKRRGHNENPTNNLY